MNNNIKISACVILYNPGGYIVQNIKLIINQVQKLYIIDNSDVNDYQSAFGNKNIAYIKNNENKGIASALNQAAVIALADGYDYLLTLDQDSLPEMDLIEKYSNYINTNNSDCIGLLSPNYIYKDFSKPQKKLFDHPVLVALTSGSLLNLHAYDKCGPFKDEYFIDYVDYEYCLRLRNKGFQIIKIWNAFINHSLGSIKTGKFLFVKVSVTNHSPLRLFYRTRNRFSVYSQYFTSHPFFVFRDFIVFLNELVKILFFEDNKFEKYKLIIAGFYCFLRNKMGRYNA